MKILRVISSVNPAGGGPIEGIKQITPVLLERGHTTEVVSTDLPGAPFLKELRFPVHALGSAGSGYGYTKDLVPWLRQNADKFDCVVINGIWQYSSFGTWLALRKMQTPYCVFTHGMLDPWFKRTYPLKHLKKALYWPWGEYRVLRDARVVCFTSEEERLQARKSFRPYHCYETVVRYGTSGPQEDPESQLTAFYAAFPQLQGKRLLLFLSRIHVKKGCDLLINGFAAVAQRYPGLHLVMAGPDQVGWQAELQAQATRLGIAERITWTGMLAGSVKWGAFRAADAFALPSHQENFGISVVEALACGCPVLISNKVNIWREIEDDGAGMVAADDQAGITRLLMEWLGKSRTEQIGMGYRARRCFLARFEITQAAESLIETLCTHMGRAAQ